MMNKHIVTIWVKEVVFNLRELECEAPSFAHLQAMTPAEFAESIEDYHDVIDTDWGGVDDEYDLESLHLLESLEEVIPADELPDVEDIDPNAGRGK